MKCRKGKDETMKIAWVHKLLGKHSRKFYGILAGILTAAVAGSGVGYHVIAASDTADQTEEDTQIDETDGQEDGSFSGTGTTQVKTESQLPDFSVNAVTMTVEEVYVEAGSTVAEGDALFKIDDESMADAKASTRMPFQMRKLHCNLRRSILRAAYWRRRASFPPQNLQRTPRRILMMRQSASCR